MERVRCLGAALLFIVLVSLSLPGITYASHLCRSDPTVKLSNGLQLEIGATISALQTQVTQVHYELHVPAGVTLASSVRTPGWSISQETFSLVADQKPNQYRVITTVSATVSNVSFTAYTTVKNKGQVTYSVSGTSSTSVSLSFSS